MKKLFALLLTLAVALCAFGCVEPDDSSDVTKAEYTMVMPDGAPVLAAINLIKNYPEIDGHKMNYRVVPASNIGQEFVKNDIAILPTNAAAKLYNQGIDLKLASVNVFGTMYMIGEKEFTSFEELKGKVVYSIGQGNTPELLMKYFLNLAGVEYLTSDTPVEGKVAFRYVNEGPEVIQAMLKYRSGVSNKQADYGVIGQPAAKNALAKISGTKIVLDFQSEWKKTNEADYAQAGVVVKGNVAGDASFIAALRNALAENYEFITENPDAITEVLTANDSSLKSMTFDKALIDSCNIGYRSAADVKAELEAYFVKATDYDEAAKVFYGNKLPDDKFYLK